VIEGTFVRYRRPTTWPWAAAAAVGLAAVVGAVRVAPAMRRGVTVALGGVGGVAAIASLASFGTADSPTGRVAWVELALAGFVALAAAAGLVRLRGERRVTLAALIGAAAAATTLDSLGVFRHDVVISSLPPSAARLVCALAFTAGLGAASAGLLAKAGRT
jgi:hypothetical protein